MKHKFGFLYVLIAGFMSSTSFAGWAFWCDSSINGIATSQAGSFHVYHGNSQAEYFARIDAEIFSRDTSMYLKGQKFGNKIRLVGKEYGNIESNVYRGHVEIYLDRPFHDLENRLYYSGRFSAQVVAGGNPGQPTNYENLGYRCYPILE